MVKKIYNKPAVIIAKIHTDVHLLADSPTKELRDGKWWFWDADRQDWFEEEGGVNNDPETIPSDDARETTFWDDWE